MVNILPHSIRTPRTLAFEAVMARLQEINLSVLDVYDIDNVTAEALFELADQFNVLGLRGWALAETEAERRALIKEAIQLHQIAGTPQAILRAMELVGYPDATIEENPGPRYDGSNSYNGSIGYTGAQLGAFIVTLDSERSTVSTNQIALIIGLINEWKNARSWLLDLRIGDVSLINDNLFVYDGSSQYDGLQEYDGVLNL